MNSFSNNVSEIVDDLELEKKYDKAIIKHRFLEEISYYEKKRDDTKKYYNVFRFIVTTGSILLPAILSMGQMDPAKLPKHFDMITYWCSWTISLMVTASNGFLQLFSLDKNYFSYSMVVEQLKTEGWQFFGLSGKYDDFENHQHAYKSFSKSVESIKRKQVEQEFSNGKGENKKKKFDFKGEMQKFSNEQDAKIKLVQSVIPNETPQLTENIQSAITSNIQSAIQNKVEEVQENVTEKIDEVKKDIEQGASEVKAEVTENIPDKKE
jgi:hypothetical protein